MKERYIREIKIRDEIMNKPHQGIPITKQERTWLVTHSLFNWKFGYPFLNICVEKIKPKTLYTIKVIIENINYHEKITPVFGVPENKGYIFYNHSIEDINGNIFPKKEIKVLGFKEIEKQKMFSFEYYSELGLISISYECDYFDTAVNLKKREGSSTGNPNFSFIRNQIMEGKIEYKCKNPTNSSFDALVFSIEIIDQSD